MDETSTREYNTFSISTFQAWLFWKTARGVWLLFISQVFTYNVISRWQKYFFFSKINTCIPRKCNYTLRIHYTTFVDISAEIYPLNGSVNALNVTGTLKQDVSEDGKVKKTYLFLFSFSFFFFILDLPNRIQVVWNGLSTSFTPCWITFNWCFTNGFFRRWRAVFEICKTFLSMAFKEKSNSYLPLY